MSSWAESEWEKQRKTWEIWPKNQEWKNGQSPDLMNSWAKCNSNATRSWADRKEFYA